MKITEIKSVSDLLKNDIAIKIIVFIGLSIIVLILFFDLFEFGKISEGSENTDLNTKQYISELETKLAGIISEISGVGKIKVMLTLENLDENVYSQKETSLKTIKTPVVRGVAIVCEGGDNMLIKEKIVETVSKVLGISTSRVSVTY